MASVTTKLVKDGNSLAIRLPKTILDMSGLSGHVELEAKKGVITLRKVKHPRANWEAQIKKNMPLDKDEELADWDNTLSDGLPDSDGK